MRYGKYIICMEEHSEHFYLMYLSVDGGSSWELVESCRAYCIEGGYLMTEEFVRMLTAMLDLGYQLVPAEYRRQRLGLAG